MEKPMEMVSIPLRARGRSWSRMLTELMLQMRTTITHGTPISMRLTI
ncbi:hypothetical protein GA0061098_10853 [Bradyrhizobium shewense]|uniref:Uncharacterized protein n=1 Tax=Bradyrhizobium shewense TaxID=1761772 RepID=A0A1C3XVU5_9BRAD|nr:hypothetical protein GA0061098_10853 [Bradyrhizobium shewense]